MTLNHWHYDDTIQPRKYLIGLNTKHEKKIQAGRDQCGHTIEGNNCLIKSKGQKMKNDVGAETILPEWVLLLSVQK